MMDPYDFIREVYYVTSNHGFDGAGKRLELKRWEEIVPSGKMLPVARELADLFGVTLTGEK